MCKRGIVNVKHVQIHSPFHLRLTHSSTAVEDVAPVGYRAGPCRGMTRRGANTHTSSTVSGELVAASVSPAHLLAKAPNHLVLLCVLKVDGHVLP